MTRKILWLEAILLDFLTKMIHRQMEPSQTDKRSVQLTCERLRRNVIGPTVHWLDRLFISYTIFSLELLSFYTISRILWRMCWPWIDIVNHPISTPFWGLAVPIALVWFFFVFDQVSLLTSWRLDVKVDSLIPPQVDQLPIRQPLAGRSHFLKTVHFFVTAYTILQAGSQDQQRVAKWADSKMWPSNSDIIQRNYFY